MFFSNVIHESTRHTLHPDTPKHHTKFDYSGHGISTTSSRFYVVSSSIEIISIRISLAWSEYPEKDYLPILPRNTLWLTHVDICINILTPSNISQPSQSTYHGILNTKIGLDYTLSIWGWNIKLWKTAELWRNGCPGEPCVRLTPQLRYNMSVKRTLHFDPPTHTYHRNSVKTQIINWN